MFLKGKTAIVTGSTSGIGLAYAQALAAEGAQVMINGFGDAAEIEKERAALEKTSGKALYDAADMTKPDELAAMVQRCHDRSEEHTSELQSLMRHSYAVFCLNKKHKTTAK